MPVDKRNRRYAMLKSPDARIFDVEAEFCHGVSKVSGIEFLGEGKRLKRGLILDIPIAYRRVMLVGVQLIVCS
jgi:hypothetical protein